jgi:2-polyprenyl-3-methyl-5-hydroxy-6-metoxy-1,4-benzoquinol methylase
MLIRIGTRVRHALHRFWHHANCRRDSSLGRTLAARTPASNQKKERRDVPLAPQVWDEQYAAGRWDFMAALPGVAHYAVITGYIHFLKPHSAVLDVGCGEGILLNWLRPYGYARYVGVDVSSVAIARAESKQDSITSFRCGDAESFDPGETFDVIVFNEVLYYLHDPLSGARRFGTFLKPDGILIVSTYAGSDRAFGVLHQLREAFTVLHETSISNSRGGRNICSVLTPKSAPQPSAPVR